MKSSKIYIFSVIILLISIDFVYTSAGDADAGYDDSTCEAIEIEAKIYLEKLNIQLKEKFVEDNQAKYNYSTNITEENRLKMISVATKNAQFFKDTAAEVSKLNYDQIKNQNILRQIKWLKKLRYNALPENDYNEFLNAVSHMQTNYAKVLVCEYKNPDNCKMSLEPEIELHMRESRDPDELKYYWKEFYDKAGTPVKNDFLKYIEIGKKAAQLNNHSSMAESWIAEYEDPQFEEHFEEIYQEILPFYKQLHAYVRHRLNQNYGNIIEENGNLPMHLLGNLWGQSWKSIFDLLKPFPEKEFFNVTGEMIRQGYTAVKIFQMGDDFFQSINMTKLPPIFWTKSVLEKPTDRDIICHASAWDFYEKDIVAIKQCTKINMQHFYIVHHELGHVQYFLQYQDQPVPFRDAPNPGFHEAVGDVIALSVSTAKHLEKIGLLKNFVYDEKSQINQLFEMALSKVIFLPFAYTLDKYRHEVFRGNVPLNKMNCAFWEMRSEFGGIEPAVERSENDFDPTAKFHVASDVEYLRYFAAHIFQFQFHKAMCIKAGQYIKGDKELTLDNCDVHGSAEAGNAFKAMLSLGGSKPWEDALEAFTGERKMTASGILEYFAPLQTWLAKENEKMGVKVGWDITKKCKSSD